MRKIFCLLSAAAVLAVSGCGSDNPVNPLAPFQPQIINQADNFAFQISNVQSLTTTVSYVWQNSGSEATIDHSSVVTNGTASLTILDDNGSQVYAGPLLASGTHTTSVGVTGNWTIRVAMSGMDADQVNFRVQKK